MSVSYGGDSITFADGSVQSGGWTGFKNRIINGGMVIDQRNAGAAISTHGAFVIDRFSTASTGGSASGITVQQSTTVPLSSGFTNSIVYTVGTGGAVGASGSYGIQQRIEGYNFSDMLCGTASAKEFTLSFWVRSSLTGTFGVSFRNSAKNRTYIASYTINSANTWEYKTITITGDTSGTWLTNNGIGLDLFFDLGVGTTSSTTANSWQAGNYTGLTGGVKLVETTGATFYITGVQLERGSTASSFDYRDFGRELIMCQRYFISTRISSPFGQVAITGQAVNTSRIVIPGVQYPVVMRDTPTVTIYSASADTSGAVVLYNSTSTAVGSGFVVSLPNQQGFHNRVDGSASLTAGNWYSFSYTAAAEL